MIINKKIKFQYIKLLIYIVLIIVFSTFFKNYILLANQDSCIDYDCYEKRIINVLLLYDNEIFFDKEWEDNIKNRFDEINKFYYSNFKIEWRIIDKKQFKFDKNINSLSTLFTLHKSKIAKIIYNTKAEVVLGVIGRDIKGLGIAATFSNIVMVADSLKFKSFENSVVLAHEFGHLFGAWHTRRKNDFMLVSGAKQLLTSKESNTILKLMRNYKFDPKILVNNDIILNRISRLYNRHHAIGEIDPVARLLTDSGNKLYLNKEYKGALKLLIKSNEFFGRWGETRMILSKTYYELGLYNKSFTELTRAMFFGSKLDIDLENNLKKKFIDLQKIDPTIKNPFNLDN
ncbi:MAG TPA: hypothetical protein EYQ51_08655 [Alphaproteobacteria bacterium]|jgi:hypothetical protein|nr:hypothetical protein [Alphaproteobacteria bacterium]HIK87362.1 hypothetical protein [Alphaproteobacteria bacterium]